MKIGMAVGYFDPQTGGSEEVVKQLASHLLRRGHDVVVATSRHRQRRAHRMVVPVVEFDVAGNSVTGMTGDIDRYRDYLRRSDRDVWLFYAAQIWSTDAALDLLGLLGAATVVVPCGYSGLSDPAYSRYFATLPTYLQEADALVYMSRRTQDYTHDAQEGLAHLAHVIPNGASEDEFMALTPRGSEEPGQIVITVANHYSYKGHDLVLDAFKRGADRAHQLLIVGGRPELDPRATCWWRCRFEAFREPRVSLVSGSDRREVLDCYRRADVFLFASRIECAPLVIIEAMAAGVPFISTNIGNVQDYPGAGLVVPQQELPEALTRLLDDPVLRSNMGAVGRATWLDGQRWSQIASAYEDLFMSLTS